jgi:uncharacterized membrane protein
MRASANRSRPPFRVARSIDIDADVERVFALWSRYEDFPRVMENVRRVKRIDDRVLWDVDIGGRQVVWEARIVETVPGKRIRWQSSWGASHSGEVRFAWLPGARTRLVVEIEFRTRGLLEYLGARAGLVDTHVGRDLDRFRRFAEGLARDEGEGH